MEDTFYLRDDGFIYKFGPKGMFVYTPDGFILSVIYPNPNFPELRQISEVEAFSIIMKGGGDA